MFSSYTGSRRAAFVALAVALSACSGSKGPVNPTPTSSISVSAGAISLPQGGTATRNVALGRVRFSGTAALTAEGLPAGVTASFTPPSLTGAEDSSSLQLSATGVVPVGTSNITIRAAGSGVTDATTTVALTVTAGTSTPSVTLAATPTSATIVAGTSTTSAVAITRDGGAGALTMSVTGAPTGMTTSLSSANPVTAASVTLSVATIASLTPGTYTLTVRANAAGLTEATTSVAVTVNAPPANNVSWNYCDPARYPLWFAVQDGAGGPWTPVTSSTPGSFAVAYGQPQVGIAAVYSERGIVMTEIRYFALAEVAGASTQECSEHPAPGTKSITGSIAGFASSTESANIAIGNKRSSLATLADPTFALAAVQDGARDLIAVRNDASGNALRVLLLRSQNISNGGSTGVLNLASLPSFAPLRANLTVTAPNDGALLGRTFFSTATNSGATFVVGALSSGVAASYEGIPESEMLSSDLQRIEVEQTVGSTLTRSVTRYIRSPLNVSLTMPVDAASPTVTSLTGGGYPRASASGTSPAAFNAEMSLQWSQLNANKSWMIFASGGFRNGSTTYSLSMPDFSALPGWNNAWAMGNGTSDLAVQFFGRTGAGPNGQPGNGTTISTSGRRMTFTF